MTANKDPALLKGEHLMRNGVYAKFDLTVKSVTTVTRKTESGELKTGLLIYFDKASLPLFAPKDQLNWRLIRAEHGTTEPDELVGLTLKMIPVIGNWFGEENVLALRVLVTGDKPKPKVGKKAFGESVVGKRVKAEAAK